MEVVAGMTERERAERLLVLSREARWAFPSSSGRPVPAEAPPWAERFAKDRESFAEAAIVLLTHGDRAAATELAANAWRLWVLARDDARGRAFLARILDRPDRAEPSRARALALYGDGLFAFRMGDLAGSRARGNAALEAARAANDREAEGLALLGLSRVELSEGRYEQSRELAAASRELLRDLEPGHRQAPLHMLAQATRFAGTPDEAAALFEESLALNRRLGDRGMVLVELHNLGHVELRRGNVDAAERHFVECDDLAGAADDPYDAAMRLFNEAAVAFARHDRTRAAASMERARAILTDANVTLAADDAHEFDELMRRLGSPGG